MKKSIFIFIAAISMVLFSCFHYHNSQNRISQVEKSISSPENILPKENMDSSRIFKGIFDLPENTIVPSPTVTSSIVIHRDEKVVDYDVSPIGAVVAALIMDTEGNCSIKFWQPGQNKFSDSCNVLNGYSATAIVWHPKATALFAIGVKDKMYHILKIEKDYNGWTAKSIYSSAKQLRRLVVCPRPFIVGYNDQTRWSYYAYRVFFGMANTDNSYRIASVTEIGDRFYQVIGHADSISKFNQDNEMNPSEMTADWALPIAFHPAGHQLIWEDKNHNFQVADYNRKSWGNYAPLAIRVSNNGTITPTPNGVYLIHWQKDKPGIGLYSIRNKKEEIQIPQYQFITTPSSVPDGKGIVGLTQTNGKYVLNYVPINVPMADVSNAWMYVKSEEETNLFQKNFGLFRPNAGDQLYSLYETENYYCENYDMSTPTRPYMITTDIFWELFGAAYQGLFIIKERDNAIPNFRKFIDTTNQYFTNTKSKSRWVPVFAALSDLYSGNDNNPEVKRMYAQQSAYTDILKDNFDYSELKPRGHYTSSDEMQKYFTAFKYFTSIFEKEPNVMKELNSLPKEIRAYAVKWIECYMGLISSPRSALVWSDVKYKRPSYSKHPGDKATMFPLSWGIDNEIIYSTIYHSNFPADLQIIGKGGDKRLLPSGLDVAAALGNGFADSLLQPDYEKYPPLRKVINNLKNNFRNNCKPVDANENLYNKWMDALAVQWADTLISPNGRSDKNIFNAKRLQTGLASWATLRHATVLVNERGGAECGEGGFEDIVLNTPRGYVEPDPITFGAIANLFDAAVKYVPESVKEKPDEMDYDAKGSLYEGIIKRLKETAKDARLFQTMAEKEKKGEALTNEEYNMILYVGRDAEHYFLIFESLTNKDYALSTPDPIAKIADVSGKAGNYLMAAVGNAMEWDNLVPYFGRHEIVKGSIYSYFEFPSGELLNDKEWQQKADNTEYLPWLKPYITKLDLDYPATTGY